MDKPSQKFDIESALEQLIPRGLSEQTQSRLEDVIDELVEESSPTTIQSLKKRWVPYSAVASVALGALGWGIVSSLQHREASELTSTASGPSRDSIEVLEQRAWIDRGEDLGIQSIGDSGDTRHAWRYVGVEQERFLHNESGYEVVMQREFAGEHYATTSL